MNTVTSKDGTTIAFDRSGEGPALILVGGALQHRAIDPSTVQLASLLAPSFTVYHYDRRGRGDSGDTVPYAVEREIEDIDALIQEAGGSAFVFGMSSGAVLALDAAAGGLAITKLALYEPPMVVDDSRPPVPKDYVARLTELASSGRPGDAIEVFMTEGVGLPAEAVAPMRGAPFWPAFEAVAHTLAVRRRDRGSHHVGQAVADRSVGFGHDPHARRRRWRESGVGAQRSGSARGRAARRATPHAGRSDAPGRPGGPRASVGDVLHRLTPRVNIRS